MRSLAGILGFVLCALLSLSALSGCHRATPVDEGIATQTLLVGNAAEPSDLDPHIIDAWTDSNICYALFEPLAWIDERTTRPVPAAASGWDVSKDGLVYTFHLRPDGRWSTGEPVTADDFVYSIHRVLSPNLGAVDAYMLWPIKNAEAFNKGAITDFNDVGVKALDPLTLRITLARPTPYLPALTLHSAWLPVHRATIEKFGRMDERGTKWTRPGNLVGNGPFVLKEWIPNGRIVVERNPQFRDAAHVRLNRIEFFPIETGETEESAFRAGQLDVTYRLPNADIARYRREHPEELRIDPILASFYLFLNVHRPPLDNPKVRRALSLAVDREAFVDTVLAHSRLPAHAFVAPDCGGYTSRANVPTDFAEARRLLAEAGYPGGKGMPTMEALSYQSEHAVKILEVIQAEWAKELGVHITITPQEQKTLFSNSRAHNYTIAFSGWIADYPDPTTFLDTMKTGNGNNWAGWSNPRYDALLARAATLADNDQRFELFQQAEALMLQDAPLIPLYYDTEVYLKQPVLHGWLPARLNYHRFQNLWLARETK